MRELSLFSGAGGGLLGTKLLGWEHLGYVEFNEYCQKVIRQRIEDGILDRAPIFGDIRAFLDEGYADAYQGMVDVVTAGFPCQPFSVAGKQAGEDDARNMWPQTLDVIRRVRPRFAFLENVPGLLNHEYAKRILGDLAEIFPNIRGACIGNNEIASGICNSERLWIVASEADSPVLESLDFFEYQLANPKESFGRQHSRAVSAMLSQDDYSEIKRDSDAVADEMEQLKAIGNGQIPELVAAAWELLTNGVAN